MFGPFATNILSNNLAAAGNFLERAVVPFAECAREIRALAWVKDAVLGENRRDEVQGMKHGAFAMGVAAMATSLAFNLEDPAQRVAPPLAPIAQVERASSNRAPASPSLAMNMNGPRGPTMDNMA